MRRQMFFGTNLKGRSRSALIMRRARKSEERSKYCGSGGESGGESGGKSGGLLMVAARRRSMMEKARPEAKERWGGREVGRGMDKGLPLCRLQSKYVSADKPSIRSALTPSSPSLLQDLRIEVWPLCIDVGASSGKKGTKAAKAGGPMLLAGKQPRRKGFDLWGRIGPGVTVIPPFHSIR